MTTAHGNEGLLHVGDVVQVPFGTRKVRAVIVEDRGPLGVKGRRLFRIRVDHDPYPSDFFEVAEEDISALPKNELVPETIDRSKIVEFLKNGGLIALLRRGTTGGRKASHAWLCLDQLGNVTYTFIADRGLVGGAPIPVLALQGERIFTPKRDEVDAYLQSFGLSPDEAGEIISAVGTRP